MGGKFGQANVK